MTPGGPAMEGHATSNEQLRRDALARYAIRTIV